MHQTAQNLSPLSRQPKLCRWLAAMAMGLLCLLTSGCFVFMNLDLTPGKSPFQERVLTEASSWWTSEKVAIIDLHGLIAKRYDSPSMFSGSGSDPVSDLKEQLQIAAADPDVKAVVLRIDSPGGFVSWCDVLYRHVKTFKAQTGKPVLASITGIGASGGYYLALAADKIYASPASTVGSIGVIAIFLNLAGLADKIGVETQVIKSGPKKDMGGLWRGMTKDEKNVAQSMIDEFYKQFVNVIDERRPQLNREKILKLADGRLYTANQACEHGLIDKVAYLEEAIADVRKAAGLKDAAIITYARGGQYKSNIYSSGAQPPTVNMVNFNLNSLQGNLPSGLYYLWYPVDN